MKSCLDRDRKHTLGWTMPPSALARCLRSSRTVVLCAAVQSWCGFLSAEEGVDFEREIAPLLVTRCLECHHAGEAAGGLVLADATGLQRGGDSQAAEGGRAETVALMLERVRAGEMPPPKKDMPDRLPAEEIALLNRWREAGALWPAGRSLDLYERTSTQRAGRDWWSLQPIGRPAVPARRRDSRAENPIDLFVESRLAAESLSLAPPADRRTLLRRVSIDLTGLPPTADEYADFAADSRPDAYERLVDRLLGSPRFGERWGRHWLDVARFAETSGYERDQEKPHAWRYRDWVIGAFNDDRPYDQFVREQICGDGLPQRTIDSVIATGFLRLGTWNDEPNDPEEYKYDRLEDLVDVTCSAFLGMTVKCARCHDHKFDPIYQADYYRVAHAFWTGPIEARDAKWLGGPSPEELGFDVLGWTDIHREPSPLHVLKKGDPRRPGFVVDQQLPSFAGGSPSGDAESPRHLRTRLADWILARTNPLTPRVMVNRLWQHHFGRGLVATPSNFGFTGEKPSHPELLDWLANELVDSGWSLKHLHRLMLTSAVYRQSSVNPQAAEFAEKDAQNRWWWRAERRRLDAESLRDGLLAVSGELDLRLGGPSFKPTISADALEGLSRKSAAWTASPVAEQRRRSVYIFSQRSLLPPLLTTFDFSDTTAPCPQRDTTIAAPQALALFNNEFVHERSVALARQAIAESGQELDDQVESIWQWVLGRLPTEFERERAKLHVARQRERFTASASGEFAGESAELAALASLCHVLVNTNEFMFVD